MIVTIMFIGIISIVLLAMQMIVLEKSNVKNMNPMPEFVTYNKSVYILNNSTLNVMNVAKSENDLSRIYDWHKFQKTGTKIDYLI